MYLSTLSVGLTEITQQVSVDKGERRSPRTGAWAIATLRGQEEEEQPKKRLEGKPGCGVLWKLREESIIRKEE